MFGILGELDRGGLIETSVTNVLCETVAETLEQWDVQRNGNAAKAEGTGRFFRAAPGRQRMLTAFGQDSYFDDLDIDRSAGCIRDIAHAYSADGGLAVLSRATSPPTAAS